MRTKFGFLASMSRWLIFIMPVDWLGTLKPNHKAKEVDGFLSKILSLTIKVKVALKRHVVEEKATLVDEGRLSNLQRNVMSSKESANT